MQEPKMTKPHPIRPRPSPSEEGYILIAVIFMLALLIVAMSIAVPNISKQIERDREVETMHRGKQYVRALKLYYKKFGNYPMNVDALVNTNQIRFLRKKYIDPSTGKDEWKPIHMGEQKQPTAFGFFGKPMASQLMGGMGANCGMSGLNSSGLGSPDSSNSSFSSSNPSSSSLSSSSLGSSGLNSSMGMGTSTPIGGCPTDSSSTAGGSGASGNSSDPSNPSNPNNGTPGANGSPTDTSGSSTGGTDSSSSGGSSSSGSSSGSLSTSSLGGSSSGIGGQTFGGGGIIGFSPGSPKKTILLYKKQNHYNKWEFVYDPAQDQTIQIGGGPTGLQQSGSMPGSNGIGGTGFGGISGNTGSGISGLSNSNSGSTDSGTNGSGSNGSGSGSGSSSGSDSGSNSGSNPSSPPQ
jgi:type II secretory pathway pseudopilin PulG